MSGIYVLLLITGLCQLPTAEAGNVLAETWESAQLGTTTVGTVHTKIIETIDERGANRLLTSIEMDYAFRRGNAPLRIHTELRSEEASDGHIYKISMRRKQNGGQALEMQGAPDGGLLRVVIDGGRLERRIKWSGDVVGYARQDRFLEERRPKPGDTFSYLSYEPIYNSVVTVRGTVKEEEENLPGKPPRKLLRVELLPDRLDPKGANIQPPGSVVWLDDSYTKVKREIDMDGLGTVMLLPRGKEAPRPTGDGPLPDIASRMAVPLQGRFDRPFDVHRVTYKIALRGETNLRTALADDSHQTIDSINNDTMLLTVHPTRVASGSPAGPGTLETRAPSFFLDSDKAGIREIARKATAGSQDAWQRAQRIERWVHDAMRKDNSTAIVPASQIANELRGDCRNFAMLTAAVCKASGLPARTAIGLIYDEQSPRPAFAFHMWTEVCIGGEWIGIDATRARGGISAGYIKIADHSWHETRSLTPLLPVNRILGKISISLVAIDQQH